APGGEGGRFWLLAASLRACASSVRDRFESGLCIGGELDRMSAAGVGTAAQFEPGSATAWWGAAVVGFLASWTVSRLVSVVARYDMTLTPSQERFVLQPGSVLVHSPSRIGARAAIGVELRFF